VKSLGAKQAMKHLLHHWLYWIGKSARASDSRGECCGNIKASQKLFRRSLYRKIETAAVGNKTFSRILITRSKENQGNDNSLFYQRHQ